MSDYTTNGYLISILRNAAKGEDNAEKSDATRYLKMFRALEEKFFEKVHPFVDVGLAISEVQISSGSVPNIFTVHGSRHIADLVKTLDKFTKEIADNSSEPLTCVEAYLLLCAAHVHDAANVSKRKGHPARCDELIKRYTELFESTATSQWTYNVASVHGDEHPEFGKDTFRSLNADNYSPPRLPLLAALLRLCDELSENADRVPGTVLKAHSHSSKSKLAHTYAKSFISCELRKESLYLVYNIYPEQHELMVTVNKKPVTFYEFLEGKLDAIDKEARYCTQYGRPVFGIDQIKVTINRYASPPPSKLDLVENFTLHLNHGYPDHNGNSLCRRSPELSKKDISRLAECFVVKPKRNRKRK